MKNKSLLSILGETELFTGIVYPIFNGAQTLVLNNATFTENLQDSKNALFASGMGLDYFVLQLIDKSYSMYRQSRTLRRNQNENRL